MAKKNSPKASSWDKLSGRAPGDTLAHRDVYEGQQLDRSEIEKVRTKGPRTAVAGLVGLLAAAAAWAAYSALVMVFGMIGSGIAGLGSDSGPVFYERVPNGAMSDYCLLDGPEGSVTDTCFKDPDLAKENPPQWYTDYMAAQAVQEAAAAESGEARGYLAELMAFDMWKLLVSLGVGLSVFYLLYLVLLRNLDAQNLLNDTADINQYTGDQHIALPEEVLDKFELFPDVGAVADVHVSSMISHVMLSSKGLKMIPFPKRVEADIVDEETGETVAFKGEIALDKNGDPITEQVSIIDEGFGDALFDASGLPKEGGMRKRYDARKIAYNKDGKNREKSGPNGEYPKVVDMINAMWDLPEYEPQRPAGAYVVDTAPVNTMVLAITRAGKGQTYIEPVIDMWLREKRPNNMVINDPKGELLVKFYVRATVRGFQVVQFNLINAMKTDIYNPLGMAAEAAREGDSTKCALYVENIAEVFFPLDGGEDPVWPAAANNAFKRAAYGLIDFYLEEERQRRAYAARVNMEPKVLETELDELWGKVTLYNCYQLFVQLTAKRLKNPVAEVNKKVKDGFYGDPDDEENFDGELYDRDDAEAKAQMFLWDGADDADMLTLYFNACENLPRNTMRTLIANTNNALKSMGAAEKMLASVYGIAITAMSFFVDPTISTLTSGTPSQNVDLGGLSFPRRMGVRFAATFTTKYHLIGTQAIWDAFTDDTFSEGMGKAFHHEDTVSREGWARYYFEGKFPQEEAYLRLQLTNAQTGLLIRSFYFKFTKGYQTSLNGRYYVTDPITGEKIIKNGILVELRPDDGQAKTRGKRKVRALPGKPSLDLGRPSGQGLSLMGADGGRFSNEAPAAGAVARYVPGHTVYEQSKLVDVASDTPRVVDGEAHAVISTMVRYSEQPKAVFLVTPPHLMKYAKLILILVKQLVDLNFDRSYMTKENQKPLFKTRFMLDELGNLQSEGHGISGLETMLSIGLGQEQQFTLILQTLQQLRDVYGESVDKVVQGNTSNIVFLKSTDDAMIDTLSKMSGTRHVSYRDSKSVTKDMERVVKGLNVEGKVSYTVNTKEEPVISYNDLAFISERNSVVFRAGDSPVWNRNETILPMSWRLFKDTIIHPGHDYSLQTIPTLSSALDFDVRMNQPDFSRMLAKRMEQAVLTQECEEKYKKAFGYTDLDITRLDPDVYSEQVMELVDARMREELAEELGEDPDTIDLDEIDGMPYLGNPFDDLEMQAEIAARAKERQEFERKTYAGGTISRADLVRPDGGAMLGRLDDVIVAAFRKARPQMANDRAHFFLGATGDLLSADGSSRLITKLDETEAVRALSQGAEDESSRVFSEVDEAEMADLVTYRVEAAMYTFLASFSSWEGLADGEFERAMRIEMTR